MNSAAGMAIRSKESCAVSGHATGVHCGGVAVHSMLSLMYVPWPLFTFSFCCFLLLWETLCMQNRCLHSTVTGHAECWFAVGTNNISDSMHDEVLTCVCAADLRSQRLFSPPQNGYSSIPIGEFGWLFRGFQFSVPPVLSTYVYIYVLARCMQILLKRWLFGTLYKMFNLSVLEIS